eukprot:TRINITY_DN9602_c0_g1_i1.p1 TRINITY_DN9602_c0_g1~~TRINITY_DN9602_c0_g1_i1.p1  ORF type:complete len:376 (+),score=87.03 TRINITY_DN9602_c0_g1_i1:29-1156(+)
MVETTTVSDHLRSPNTTIYQQTMSLVTLSYQDLLDGVDLTDQIFEAYGPNGLGALTISGIPNYVEQRESLLSLGHRVAHLDQAIQQTLEDPTSLWNAGWSHGKEKLGDEPDFAKGSYYCNPVYDDPGTPELKEKYPFFYPTNIWPTEHVPELEEAFKALGENMYRVCILLAKQIDQLIKKNVPEYEENLLSDQMENTQKIKGRLLYYYPKETKSEDGWIGWHNDSGFLTALTSAMFIDDETGEAVPNPDPEGGLYIVNRSGGSTRVKIPADHLGVQCGECLQIISGGLIVATPHCVRPSASPDGTKLGRTTFPVFIDVSPEFPLSAPEGISRDQVFDKTVVSKVPPLEERWLENGTPFVEFLGDTFKKYYEWATQ